MAILKKVRVLRRTEKRRPLTKKEAGDLRALREPRLYTRYKCGHQGVLFNGAEKPPKKGLCRDCYRRKQVTKAKKLGPVFYARDKVGAREVACWSDTATAGPQLQERGYEYATKSGNPKDVRALEPNGGFFRGSCWRKRFRTSDKLMAEVEWLRAQGWRVSFAQL